jgi:hypothetical protein
MAGKRKSRKSAPRKTALGKTAAAGDAAKSERHLGATEDRVGDRTGAGAGYDLSRPSRGPRKGGVTSS